jgi:hypothetical protein
MAAPPWRQSNPALDRFFFSAFALVVLSLLRPQGQHSPICLVKPPRITGERVRETKNPTTGDKLMSGWRRGG